MATQSEEKERTGQVDKGRADAGNRTGDTTVRQQPPKRATIPVFAADLSDSPANANRQPTAPAQARSNTGKNFVRPYTDQDRLNESYRNSQNRWEAEKARRAQFRANHEGRNEWQQREHEAYDKRLKERQQRIQQFNDNVQRGNFEGMTRISDDNWSKMGEGSLTLSTNWKVGDDGKVLKDDDGNFIRETSGTVEGKIDHNSEENVKNKAALEEWSKNQWRTNFNNGVAFNRYDGGFDASKLPKGVFDKDGNLDLSKITSQKQMNALMQIMRQDQEATGAKGRKTNAEQAAAQVDKDLKASGLSDEQIAGMSEVQKTAARDQFKLNSASKALEAFYKADGQLRQNPEAFEADLQAEAVRRHLGLPTPEAERGRVPNLAQSRLDATLALREAGFSNAQIRKMIEGDDSSALRERLEARRAQQAQDAQTQQEQLTKTALAGLRGVGANPAAEEIERSIQAQQAQAAAETVGGIPTVEGSTPAPQDRFGNDFDPAEHYRATSNIDPNENPFAEEDAAEVAAFKANLADPESILNQTIRGMGTAAPAPRPGVDPMIDPGAAMAADMAMQEALAPNGRPAMMAGTPVVPAPSTRLTPVQRGGVDPTVAALRTRGGFNRAGLEATTATFAPGIYAAAQATGGATRAAWGNTVGGAIQAAGGLAASGVLGRIARAVTRRLGNPFTTRGGPRVSTPAQQVEANVQSRAAGMQGRAGTREGMVTPQQLQNRPGTPSPEQVEARWLQLEKARDAAKVAREKRAVAQYRERLRAARAEEAKISPAAAKDAARKTAQETKRLEKARQADFREQVRAIQAGRKPKPPKVHRIDDSNRPRARGRVNILEGR